MPSKRNLDNWSAECTENWSAENKSTIICENLLMTVLVDGMVLSCLIRFLYLARGEGSGRHGGWLLPRHVKEDGNSIPG
jgi:hypothetical protein